ncbi:two-component system sensor histidine kinase KdpD [Aquabacterium soli]|uniref:two-component system sensor histidine kinase KdpD n=1 Tax=Aquabacterium soli TaxID=2493092 RepID=UPI003B75D0E3
MAVNDSPRPDPDALLAQVQQDEADAHRGRLKIFFGANAGVGKTYAMLSAARAARAQGTDVLIGVVETHGRAETQALLGAPDNDTEGPLPLLAPRPVAYRDRTLPEFDLDTALARRPALILIDELAHSNVPGSRHPKRWQDVQELLDAGIDVWTTMNVQHLESLNDVVGGITGIRVWETVPDKVFDEADEVVLVDLSPDDLLQRLKEGKVYLPQQAQQAARHFFRKGNLIALRELALRRTADRVDEDMLQYRQRRAVQPVWGVRESLLACVGPGEHGDKTVRATARLAARLDVPWHAVYVETPALQRLPEQARQRVLRSLKLAQDLGATTATLTGQEASGPIVRYARQHNLSRVVIGRRDGQRRPAWARLTRMWRRPLAQRIGALGSELDLMEIALPATPSRGVPAARHEPGHQPVDWRGYLTATALCGLTAAGSSVLLMDVFEPANIVMLFLLTVVIVAMRHGRGPAVLAAVLSVSAFDFLFVHPRFSFAVGDFQYLLTLAVMLIVALLIGQMTAGVTFQARVAQRREDRMRSLYEMSRDLSGALMTEQVAEIAARFLKAEFGARSALLVAGEDGSGGPGSERLGAAIASTPAPELDAAVAQWSYAKAEPAGHGTDTLTASPVLYLPLAAPMRLRGVLAVQPEDPGRLAVPEQRRLLDTCASLLAISLERIHYIEVARASTVQMESERLRNSLLAAVSHDLRTPLASVQGLAESLLNARPPLPEPAAGTAAALHEAALRIHALVTNLLDMARLQAGAVQLDLQWQPLEEVVGSAIKASRPVLGERPVRVSLPDGLPFVHIDAVLIERVLVNLLENATKYTPAGTPIEIGASAEAEHIALWVDDHGPGLPRGREEALFNKFERGHKESATPGVGLGLAICRAIVQAHGGTIAGLTREGGGARFVIRIPRGQPPAIEDPATP